MCSLQDEQQERIQASLREREREVAISCTAQEKEWGKERNQFRKTEVQEVFKALLVDMVWHTDPNAHLSLSHIDLHILG